MNFFFTIFFLLLYFKSLILYENINNLNKNFYDIIIFQSEKFIKKYL